MAIAIDTNIYALGKKLNITSERMMNYANKTVDEIIEFLEQHRGKEFWASGDVPCFCVNENAVLCDSGDYVLNEIENDDFLEPLEQFFYHV